MAASRQELVGGGIRARVTQQVKPPSQAVVAESLAWNQQGD
jgi:hypothetical protein